MNNLKERGFAHLLLLLLLLAGIGVGVYLVQTKTNLFSKATPVIPQTPETSFELEAQADISSAFSDTTSLKIVPAGQKFRVDIWTRSDIDPVNLFVAKLKFPTDLLKVVEINRRGAQSFINHWVDSSYDNNTGDISLVGGVNPPGLLTSFQNPGSVKGITSTTDTSYDMGVLVIKYFPVTSSGLIDQAVTGDVGEPYDVIKKRTDDVTNQLKISLEKASSYLGYRDPTAKPALRYSIVDTKEYKQAVPIKAKPGRPTVPDYYGILNSQNICDYVNNKNVKEVWLWAYQGPNKPSDNQPYLGISESKMSGPSGDISNSFRDNDMPSCGKTYRVYTFNYGRYTAEALESWGHQIESEMDAVDRSLYRDKFQGLNYPQTLGVTGRCGSVHNPPNARFEYDRGNPTLNKSDCLDWNPDNLGTLSDISCQNWGCTNDDPVANNFALNYQIWLLQNMPGRGNTKTYQGKPFRNWWDVHGDFDNVMKTSRSLTFTPVSCQVTGITCGATTATSVTINNISLVDNGWGADGIAVFQGNTRRIYTNTNSSNSFTLNSLTPATAYDIKVGCYKETGRPIPSTTGFSDTITCTTQGSAPPPLTSIPTPTPTPVASIPPTPSTLMAARLMASIIFEAKKEGSASLQFTDSSQILRILDQLNILQPKYSRGLTLQIIPVSTPTPTPISTSMPKPSHSPRSTPLASPIAFQCTGITADTQLGKLPTGENIYIVNASDAVRVKANLSSLPAMVGWESTVEGNNLPSDSKNGFIFDAGDSEHMSGTYRVYDNITRSDLVEVLKASAKHKESSTEATCKPLKFLIKPANVSVPTPIATPSTEQILRHDGDINSDGKFTLLDMSALLARFRQTNIRSEADINGDGIVNSLDLLTLRNMLIQKGVIKAR